MKNSEFGLSRRDFIGTSIVTTALMTACTQSRKKPDSDYLKPGPEQAPEGPVLRAGLIGCGGRGRGAMLNFVDAGPNLQIVALADLFPERIEQARQTLKEERGQEVSEENCFVGFEAYQELINSEVDAVLLTTPPHFRPQYFEAAVNARKHAFLEKPVAVDPVGARAVMETADKADALGLCVMTGTQHRRDRNRIELYNRLIDGAIGEVLAIRCFRNQGALWYRKREEGWSDMEYMIRDWVNWRWLSGDHIVEQFIHGLDQVVWFMRDHPLKATGMGGRMRRVTGDQYDFFSIDYEFENGVHMHATTRQIEGCSNVRYQYFVGSQGSCNLNGTIYDRNGNVTWQYEGRETVASVQEHVDWVAAIRAGKPVNTARETAISTLVAIMGRDSAYTGKDVTWDELMQSEQRLGPSEYAMGPVSLEAEIPVPGEGEEPV